MGTPSHRGCSATATRRGPGGPPHRSCRPDTGSDAFAVLAHIDYPVRARPSRARPFSPERFEAKFRRVLRLLACSGRALEISTVVPLHATLLRWWHEEGGETITFGSDAHEPTAVARGFRDAVHMADAHRFRPGDRPYEIWRRKRQGRVETTPGCLRATSGVILRDADGRVLLMRRRDEDTWSIPGGGVEQGESWSDAVIRECCEETDWQAQIDGLLGIYSDPTTQVHRYPNGARRQFVGVVFTATALRRVSPGDEEAVELRWVTDSDIPEPLFNPDRPVLRDAFDQSLRPPTIG